MRPTLAAALGLDLPSDYESVGRALRERFTAFVEKHSIRIDAAFDTDELWSDLARSIDTGLVQRFTAEDVLEDAEASNCVESSFNALRGREWAAMLRPSAEIADPWTILDGFTGAAVLSHLEEAGVYTEWGDYMRRRADEEANMS